MKAILVICLLLFISGATAYTKKPVYVENGFVTGQQYLSMPDVYQTVYVEGLIDGLFASTILGASTRDNHTIKLCITNMNDVQVAAILKKYANNHPEIWNQSMGTIALVALDDMCHLSTTSK